jgi:glycosyltransferase involved in cell wall biosynthesis
VTENLASAPAPAVRTPGSDARRVLWFSHSSALGGAEIGMHEAIAALRRRGIESTVVVLSDGPLVDRLRNDGIPVLIHAYRWWMSLGPSRKGRVKNILELANVFHIRRLASLIRATGSDVVFTNTITIALPALAARVAGAQNIWYIREYGRDDHSLEFDVGDRIAYRLIDRLSSAVIVNSLTLGTHLLERGIDGVETVSYAVNVPAGYGGPPPPGEDLRLVLVGAVKPGKGQEEAVRALAAVREGGTRATLTLVGPTLAAFRESVSKTARDLGVSEHVKFTGFLEDPYPEIAAADICLVCSRREAFGRATIEAMKCGRPVIGAASGATAELIEHGVTGLLYEPGNSVALRDAIVRLDRDRELLRHLGERAQVWATERFTTEAYGRDLERVIDRVRGGTGSNVRRGTDAPEGPVRAPRH